MSLDADNIRAFAFGEIFVADADTATWPASIAAPLPGGWESVGYNDETGAKFTFGREVVEKYAWQSADPVRILSTRKPKMVSFAAMEFTPVGLGLACGGIYVTQDAAGAYRIHPQAEDFVDYRAVIIQVEDDDDHVYRFGYRRTLNQSAVDFSTVRNDTTQLPIELKVLAPAASDDIDGTEPWFIQTNDEVWAELVGDPS